MMEIMKNVIPKPYAIVFLKLLGIALISAMAGCQTTNRYIGKTVPDPNRISLQQEKSQPSVWESKDLTFEYTWDRKSSQVSLNGEITLDRSYDQFETLNYLDLWVHFLDTEGKILESKLAWSVVSVISFMAEKKRLHVNSRLDLPENATAMTFSYRGSVSEGGGLVNGGGGDGTNWSFYKSPLS